MKVVFSQHLRQLPLLLQAQLLHPQQLQLLQVWVFTAKNLLIFFHDNGLRKSYFFEHLLKSTTITTSTTTTSTTTTTTTSATTTQATTTTSTNTSTEPSTPITNIQQFVEAVLSDRAPQFHDYGCAGRGEFDAFSR